MAGGLTFGTTPRSCIIKEAGEEAGIVDPEVLKLIRSIGITSNCRTNPYFRRRVQYNFELDVTDLSDFEVNPVDGEVESFEF